MSQAKLFIGKILLFACLVAIVDFASGFLLKYVFDKQVSGKYFTTSYAINKADQDVLIFGNSHAAQHFDAPLLQKKLNRSVFNFGNQGQGLLYSYPIIKTVVGRYKPRLIILNVDYDELKYVANDRERLSVLLPYFKTNAFIDSAIREIPGRQEIKSYSAMYRYNSTLGYVLLNIFSRGYNKSGASLGYDPTPGTLCSAPIDKFVVDTAFSFDAEKINRLIGLIQYIKSQKINLLITTTPLYNYPEDAKNEYKEKLVALLGGLNVNYLDGGNDRDFKGKCELFNDLTHLNPSGAALWTTQCANYINAHYFNGVLN